MNSFVRFIFTLLIAGSAIAFGIVLLADTRNDRVQAADLVHEKALFGQMIGRFNGHLRHGQIAVEWQKIDANQQVMETSLLVRIYTLDTDGKEVPLPIVRVIIPHNRVQVEGVMLDFDVAASDEYKDLRGAKLAYFSGIYSDEQPADDRFTFFKHGDVPRDTQLHRDLPTQYELQLWRNLWDLIDTPSQAAKRGLKFTRMPPVAKAVTNGTVYSIFVGDEGASINENNDPALLNDMRREAARMDGMRVGE